MKSLMRRAFFAAVAFLTPFAAYAHEVYVLPPDKVRAAISAPAFSSIEVITSHYWQFIFWGVITTLVILVVFAVSMSRSLDRYIGPVLHRGRKYAKAFPRIAVGLSFIAASYLGSMFGPELTQQMVFGSFAPFTRVLLAIIGLCLVFHKYVRTAALIALILYVCTCYKLGWYMLTYTNYFGEIIVLLFITSYATGPTSLRGVFERIGRALEPYYFFILRVTFGISLLYASLYAKFLHNNLALQIASLPLAGHSTSLSYVFGFDPAFLVVGAGIMEILIALFFIFGIEIRFTSLFLEFWLTLSLLYFGEMVWPHIILIGIPLAFIFHGYDRTSIEGYFFKRGSRSPVL